jgi:drug/metabolite transporter (DMT)-like permease
VTSSTTSFSSLFQRVGPALAGASSFACADVLSKIALRDGSDVLTTVAFRGVVGVVLLYLWLRVMRRKPLATRARWIGLGLGILFAGNVYWLVVAIDRVGVPVAILTYFVYPLLTGIAGAATGIDRLSWRGAVTALIAFVGLGLMIGAHPGHLAIIGIVAALGAACCRVVTLLITRSMLSGEDARQITWYSLASSTVIFVVWSLVEWHWVPPQTGVGWVAFVLLGITTMTGLLGVFASTMNIGPFHTALFMNLEPLLATVASALFLGEIIAPLQAVGGAMMIAALVVFQLRR